jgi:uncharacterized metal-binding protein YceD (DUF177 family)
MTKHAREEEPHGFRRTIAAGKIGEQGLRQTITANEQERAKIAAFLGLQELRAFTAELDLARWRAKGVRVTGTFKADVVQTCVVTLEPLDAHVEASFERRFQPPEKAQAEIDETKEIMVDPLAEDPPEPMGHDVDVGEILVEELSLSLDPYPRKPGVEYKGDSPEAKRDNPFAALAKLKPKLAKKAD